MTYLVWGVFSQPDLREKIEDEVTVLSDYYTDVDLLGLPWLNGIISETLPALRIHCLSPSPSCTSKEFLPAHLSAPSHTPSTETLRSSRSLSSKFKSTIWALVLPNTCYLDISCLAGSTMKCPAKQRSPSIHWAQAPVLVSECTLRTWSCVWLLQNSSACSNMLVWRLRQRRSVWRCSTFSLARPRDTNAR